ncbi:SDR family NAD(P)-dependent oxidoreductase [Geomicrobium sp. JSM 1781026]|uniref:SDR family NAD(P)-dependent oxidoreductase n=1 Tax=Geomicrobium sp. JSM 1781026 TaxID=3344580 RepID=UPI0035C06774
MIERLLYPRLELNEQKLDDEVTGKTIVITGASSGIGEQLVKVLAKSDCHLILAARRLERLASLQQSLHKERAHIDVYGIDLREEVSRERFVDFARDVSPQIDVLVHCAGHSIRRPVRESASRMHDFTRTMVINYFAPVHLTLSFLPELEESGGHVISMSTINACLPPMPHFSAYQASKSAFDAWLRSAAEELERVGVVVTTMYLPLVRTPMIEPTKAYGKAPAMSVDQVAVRVGRAIYKRQTSVRPWWLSPLQYITLHRRNLRDYSAGRRGNDADR